MFVEGAVDLIEGLVGAVNDSIDKNPELRNKMRHSGNLSSRKKPTKEQNNVAATDEKFPQEESIKGDGRHVLRNPHVAKALSNVYADYRFSQYEKKGFLDLCFKQREERLGEK